MELLTGTYSELIKEYGPCSDAKFNILVYNKYMAPEINTQSEEERYPENDQVQNEAASTVSSNETSDQQKESEREQNEKDMLSIASLRQHLGLPALPDSRNVLQTKEQLASWVSDDEALSHRWEEYLKKYEAVNPDDAEYWKKAMEEWLRDTGFSREDPFNRRQWQRQAQSLIREHADQIFADTGYPSALFDAWHIVHHMDHYPEFQQWFLQEFERRGVNDEAHPNHQQYQYLYDRTMVNQGQDQRYGTQGNRFSLEHSRQM